MKTVPAARKCLFLALLAALCAASVFVCVSVGSVAFTAEEILRALVGDDGSTARLLVYELRLPRVLSAGFSGVCLALAGCILQAVMRNHMASPSTIGVTSGAAFAGYMTLAAFPAYAYLLPVGAIAGAFAVTMLICALAGRHGMNPMRMILSGMAVSALFGAVNDAVRTFFADALGNVSGFLVGGFNGCTWDDLRLIAPFALCGLALCALLPTRMNILLLGDETAGSLGMNVGLFRFLLIAVSSLLSGSAIAVAGLIGFVGLIVPHMARLMVGSDYKFLFPASAMLGFVLVVACDTVGRVIIAPGEVPAGVMLSLIGAPFFLWLLHTREKGGEG